MVAYEYISSRYPQMVGAIRRYSMWISDPIVRVTKCIHQGENYTSLTQILIYLLDKQNWKVKIYAFVHFNVSYYTYRLQLNVLLEPTSSLATGISREMQLLLERKRLSIWGITSYEMHKTSGKIVFPACSSLYHCLDTGFNVSYQVFSFLQH